MSDPILKIAVCVFLSAICCKGEEIDVETTQSFTQVPEDKMASVGDDVILKCAVRNQMGKAQWTKDGFALGFDRIVPGYPRYRYIGNESIGEQHLVITGITIQDDGEYQCQVGPVENVAPIWASANVTVLVPPSSISMEGWKGETSIEVESGSPVEFYCLVKDSRPIPNIYWLIDDFPIDKKVKQKDVVTASARSRLKNLESHVTIIPTAENDGSEIKCKAEHPALKSDADFEASVMLSVLHKPKPPKIFGYDDNQILKSGDDLQLICETTGGNPRPMISWYKNGSKIENLHAVVEELKTKSTLEVIANRSMDGVTFECRVSNDLLAAPLSEKVDIKVHYPTEAIRIRAPKYVHENASISFQCETEPSNPPTTIFWSVNGMDIKASASSIKKIENGGFVTSSYVKNFVVSNVRSFKASKNLEKENNDVNLKTFKESENFENSKHLEKIEKSKKIESSKKFENPKKFVNTVKFGKSENIGKSAINLKCLAKNTEFNQSIETSEQIYFIRKPEQQLLEGLDGNLIAGKTVLLSCSSKNGTPPPVMRLLKNGATLPLKAPTSNKLKKYAEIVSEVLLKPSDNRANVSCELEHRLSGTFLSVSAILNVFFPPREITPSVVPPTVDAGETVILSCQSSPSNPAANISWTEGGKPLFKASQEVLPSLNGGFVTRSRLELTATPIHEKEVFMCFADNDVDKFKPSVLLPLTVNHAPIWLEKIPKIIQVVEGSNFSVSAKISARPGPISYVWRKGNIVITNGPNQNSAKNRKNIQRHHKNFQETNEQTFHELKLSENSLQFFQIKRNFSGNFSVNIENEKGSIHTQFFIDVLYPPSYVMSPNKVTVNENSRAVLECSADGNPAPEVSWTRLSWSNFVSSGKGVVRLVIDKTTHTDTGNFVCVATNKIGTKKASQPSRLIVKHAPISVKSSNKYSAILGKIVTIECLMKSAPRPVFIWKTSGQDYLENSTYVEIFGPELMDTLSLWKSTLSIKSVAASDYKNYVCEAHNVLGVAKSNFKVVKPRIPPTPTDFKVVNASAKGEVLLTWSMKSSNSENLYLETQPYDIQQFIIRYWKEGSSTYKEKYVPGNRTKSKITFANDFLHLAIIRSLNAYGQSPYTHPPVALGSRAVLEKFRRNLGIRRAAGITTETAGYSIKMSRLLMLMLILSGVSLLALNLVVVVCFLRRKKKRIRNMSQGSVGKPASSSIKPRNSNQSNFSSENDEKILVTSQCDSAHSQVFALNSELQKENSDLESSQNSHIPNIFYQDSELPNCPSEFRTSNILESKEIKESESPIQIRFQNNNSQNTGVLGLPPINEFRTFKRCKNNRNGQENGIPLDLIEGANLTLRSHNKRKTYNSNNFKNTDFNNVQNSDFVEETEPNFQNKPFDVQKIEPK